MKSQRVNLNNYANKPQHCNYCMKVTETVEWDCKICGFSKPVPKEYWDEVERRAVEYGETKD